jgi:hypothetical protein
MTCTRLWYMGLLKVLLLGISGYVRAESIKQCFRLSNFPDRSVQSVWIQEAELREESVHKALAKRLTSTLFSSLREKHLPVLLQEITNGEGLVFVYRERFKGWPGLTDTGTLQHLTVHIPGGLSKNREIDLSKEDNVLTVLTEGVPSFRNFCFGYAKKGKISFQVSNGYDNEFMNKISQPIFSMIGKGSIVMNIDVTLTTKNTNEAWQEQCGVCTLQGTLVFSKSSLSVLNAD